jgi:hypothetical protein
MAGSGRRLRLLVNIIDRRRFKLQPFRYLSKLVRATQRSAPVAQMAEMSKLCLCEFLNFETAIVFDVRINLPDTDKKGDAIQICLDHADSYSVEVFLPYEIVESGRVICGAIFADKG